MALWIGVDLDRTLAQYSEWKSPTNIGDPVPQMQATVLRLLLKGKKIKIFTARAHPSNPFQQEAIKAIESWCQTHLGQVLEVTCSKDFEMEYFYDDRAIQVEPNTGRVLGNPSII